MKIGVIVGSQRSGSSSRKVAEFFSMLFERKFQTNSVIFDLSEINIGYWDTDFPKKEGKKWSGWSRFSAQLGEVDALVIVVPEWSGMAPPILKNFLLLVTCNEVGDKPVLIASVSSGMGGSYPISELRANSSKNNRICFIPDQIVIRKVDDVINSDLACEEALSERIQYHLGNLICYSKAMKDVRHCILYDERFKYGM